MTTEYERREAEVKASLREQDAPDWRLMDTVEPCPFPRQMMPKELSEALDERAAKLRMQGKSFGQIAQRLGIPKSSAHKGVKRCMLRLRQEFAERRFARSVHPLPATGNRADHHAQLQREEDAVTRRLGDLE